MSSFFAPPFCSSIFIGSTSQKLWHHGKLCHPERSESSRSEVSRSRRTPVLPAAAKTLQGILTMLSERE
jgi:hypothetical protein